MKVLLRTGLVLSSLGMASVAFAEDRVIYGEDNRKDLYDPKNDDLLLDLAQSTAILVRDTNLSANQSNPLLVNLPKRTFRQGSGLCEKERFGNQINPGFCSGFLVGPDLFVTAGHCITSTASCDGTSMIFGFGLENENTDLTSVSKNNVYHCKSIVKREYETGLPGRDYAVIKLDRPVQGRAALKLRRVGSVQVGDPIAVIGHPAGLPTKISDGAKVRTVLGDKPYFIANLDTYGGNSGSAVFNAVNGEVEGILVRGETDFVGEGNCMVSKRCKDSECRGEDVTKTELFMDLVP